MFEFVCNSFVLALIYIYIYIAYSWFQYIYKQKLYYTKAGPSSVVRRHPSIIPQQLNSYSTLHAQFDTNHDHGSMIISSDFGYHDRCYHFADLGVSLPTARHMQLLTMAMGLSELSATEPRDVSQAPKSHLLTPENRTGIRISLL